MNLNESELKKFVRSLVETTLNEWDQDSFGEGSSGQDLLSINKDLRSLMESIEYFLNTSHSAYKDKFYPLYEECEKIKPFLESILEDYE